MESVCRLSCLIDWLVLKGLVVYPIYDRHGHRGVVPETVPPNLV